MGVEIRSARVCGVLIEPRSMRNIYELINNFRKVMVDTYLYFFCGESYFIFLKNYYRNDKYVIVISCGTDCYTTAHKLIRTLDFWNTFPDRYTHVLTIRTDGCLCENSPMKIQDFYDYDFVGGYTPHKWWWVETRGLHNFEDYQCFDGGFSLRNISAMKDVIINFPCDREGESYVYCTEDLYFVTGLLKLNKNLKENMYKVGLDERASKFCTYTHYINDTFCVHKYDTFANNVEDLSRFLLYCPEFIGFTADKQYIF